MIDWLQTWLEYLKVLFSSETGICFHLLNDIVLVFAAAPRHPVVFVIYSQNLKLLQVASYCDIFRHGIFKVACDHVLLQLEMQNKRAKTSLLITKLYGVG